MITTLITGFCVKDGRHVSFNAWDYGEWEYNVCYEKFKYIKRKGTPYVSVFGNNNIDPEKNDRVWAKVVEEKVVE